MKRRLLSARLERHLRRGEELLELNLTAFERITSALDRFGAHYEQNERRWEERDTHWQEQWAKNEARWEERDARWKKFSEERDAHWEAQPEKNEARWEEREARWEEREARWEEREAHFNQRLDENAQFMREINLRTEKVVKEMVRHNEEFNARAERQTNAILAEVREACEETRAHREALLALIDRMPPAAAA